MNALRSLVQNIKQIQNQSPWRVNQIYWLCLGAIGLWLLSRTLNPDTNAPTINYIGLFALLFIAAINLTLRAFEAARRRPNRDGAEQLPGHKGWVFTITDMLLIAAGLRLTGGAFSPLWMVLFVVVIAETINAHTNEAHLVRWGSALALFLGTVPFPPHSPQEIISYLLDFAFRAFFLVAVSVVTRRLRIRNEADVSSLRAELALSGERSRLAREIHDAVGNELAGSVMRLELAARIADKGGNSETHALLKDEAQALRGAMNSVRDWTFFTKPWSATVTQASTPGIPVAPSELLISEIERLTRRTGMQVHVEGAIILDTLPGATLLATLRIVQEAVTNAAKYAHTADPNAEARVEFKREHGHLLLTISDTGPGFDPNADETRNGVGLSSMQERATGVGGSFHIDAHPGKGVTVTASLPATR